MANWNFANHLATKNMESIFSYMAKWKSVFSQFELRRVRSQIGRVLFFRRSGWRRLLRGLLFSQVWSVVTGIVTGLF